MIGLLDGEQPVNQAAMNEAIRESQCVWLRMPPWQGGFEDELDASFWLTGLE
jgi:hypothetical protein